MGCQEKGRPKHRRPNCEMIFEVARARSKFVFYLAVLIESAFAKTFVCGLIVVRKIKTMLDERGARIRVVADTVSSNPWVQ